MKSFTNINGWKQEGKEIVILSFYDAQCGKWALIPDQSDHGLFCSSIVSTEFIDSVSEQQMPFTACTDLQAALGLRFVYTVELQWLERLWDHRKLFEPLVVPANEG